MFQIEITDDPADLAQILELQRRNHIKELAEEVWTAEGFVTLEFDTQKLGIMKGKYKHVIARHEGKLAGYALVLLKEQSGYFPFLDEMFEVIEASVFDGMPLKQRKYFVMGQVCIDQPYRGKRLFRKLYLKLKEQMQSDFDLVITEVSDKNQRSVKAHEKMGFRQIENEAAFAGTEWKVIAWDWS